MPLIICANAPPASAYGGSECCAAKVNLVALYSIATLILPSSFTSRSGVLSNEGITASPLLFKPSFRLLRAASEVRRRGLRKDLRCLARARLLRLCCFRHLVSRRPPHLRRAERALTSARPSAFRLIGTHPYVEPEFRVRGRTRRCPRLELKRLRCVLSGTPRRFAGLAASGR